jgi:putative transcriptional regulator
MNPNNYQGNLIIAQPRCLSNFFAKSTVLIGEHAHNGAWGVITNRVFSKLESGLGTIMQQTGIEVSSMMEDHPLYVGGPLQTNQINVVHTLDWQSQSTRKITDQIGITSDLSVLVAIAGNQGPEQFRACVGICRWGEGQLEGEMAGLPPWLPEHRWLTAPATVENIFGYIEVYQWQNAIMDAAKETTKAWL